MYKIRLKWLAIFIFLIVAICYWSIGIDNRLILLINPKIVHNDKRVKNQQDNSLGEFLLFEGAKLEENLEFRSMFDSKCKPWRMILESWKRELLESQGSRTVAAFQEHSGLGDRLSGIQGALVNALELRHQLQVDWFSINEIFEETDFIKVSNFDYKNFENKSYIADKGHLNLEETIGTYVFRLVGKKYWNGYREKTCADQIYWRCNAEMHRKNKCDIYNRACSSGALCNALSKDIDIFPPPVRFVGCPLRYLLKFKKSFINSSKKLKYYFKGKEVETSFKELVQILTSLDEQIISIHLRLGDKVIKEKNLNNDKVLKVGVMDHTLLTSNGLTEYENNLLSNSYSCFNNSLIIFASDNERLREYVRKTPEYSSRTLILSKKPVHLNDVSTGRSTDIDEKNDILDTFQEWFLIYLSDDLVTNSGHLFGISSFSRSARLFRLKARYFLVGGIKKDTCTKEMFGYEGNIKKVKTICNKEN